jgi:aspartate/methionine/tyrosine aminotransferase
MALAPEGTINLALGELGYSFPDILKNKAIEILNEGDPRYTANAGIPELRARIAQIYNSGSDNVCVTNGAEEALYICLQAIVNENDTVVIPDPDYPAYPSLAHLAGANIIRLPLKADFMSFDWTRMNETILQPKVFLMSCPSNPCGFIPGKEDMQKLCQLLTDSGGYLIVDEVYSEIYTIMPELPDYSSIPNLIRISGLSKSHLMSGWRIGWIHGPKAFITSATKLKQYISTCPPWLSQHLASFALDCAQIPTDIRRQMAQNRKLIEEAFHNRTFHLPSASPYAMIYSDDALATSHMWMQKGVLTAPGIAYGEISKNWIRINYAVEKKLLEEALKRIL